MRCQACRTASIELLECRQYGGNPEQKLWLYRCPYCHAAYTAKRENWTDLPLVFFLGSGEDLLAPLPGGVVQQAEDILTANPDPEKRVWYGSEEAPPPVLVAPHAFPLRWQYKTTPYQEQADVCSFCQKSSIPIYHCIGCGRLICFSCSSKAEHGRVCAECAPNLRVSSEGETLYRYTQ
jgi:hypothetical protein